MLIDRKILHPVLIACLTMAIAFGMLSPNWGSQVRRAQAAGCTAQTRTSPVPAANALTFLKKNDVPLSALLEVAKIEGQSITSAQVSDALTKGGMKDAQKFADGADNDAQLIDIVYFSPSRLLLADAYKVFDTYKLAHNLLGEIATIGLDEAALQARLGKLGLSPSQVDGFLTDARPLILKARQSGLIRFSLTVSLADALNEAHFQGYTFDVGEALSDSKALTKLLTDDGVKAADLQPLLDKITVLEKEGLSADLMSGWEIRIVVGMLQAYGLPTISINELVEQSATSDAISACLKAFGLSGDEAQLLTIQLYRYLWDQSGAPFITPDHILEYEDSEVAALLDRYGIHSDEALNAIFENINNPTELKAFFKNQGLSDDQIANLVIDLQGSLFTDTVDPATAAVFIKQFDQAEPVATKKP